MNGKRHSSWRILAALAAVLALVSTPLLAVAQQGGTTRYVYDDNGRLRAVVSPAGEAAVYDYDAAGNFTGVRRLAATVLELITFYPKVGAPGDLVTFVGVGFGTGVSSVSFNGATAQIVLMNSAMVVAKVPDGASSGPVTIATPTGAVTTAEPFTVRGVSVTPSTAILFPGQTTQFMAVAIGTSDPSVRWSVNGIEGGNSTVGTITTTGLYTAPNTPNPSITVRATSVEDPMLFGEALVTVRNPDDFRAVLGASVTVKLLPVAGALPISPSSSSVSVRLLAATGAMSVGPFGSGVTVRLLPPSSAAPISPFDPGVTVTTGPSISSVSPTSLSGGTTATITINGINFGGATAIKFINANGAVDASITFSNLAVNSGGTVLTATLTVGASAALGQRIVVVSSPAGNSQNVNVGMNSLLVAP